MRMYPKNSKKELVYHNNKLCPEFEKSKSKDIENGTGIKKLCPHCKKINDEGK